MIPGFINVPKDAHQQIKDVELFAEIGLAVRLGEDGPHKQAFSSYVLEDGVAKCCSSLQLVVDPLKLRSVFNKDPFKMSSVEQVCFLLDKDWKPQLLLANQDKWMLKQFAPAEPDTPTRVFYIDRKKSNFFMGSYFLCLVVLELGLLKCAVPHHETDAFYKQLLSTIRPQKINTTIRRRKAPDADKIAKELESVKRQKKQHKEVEDTEAHDKSFYRGKSRFTFKAHNQIPGAGYYQADCPLNECKHKEFDEDGKISATRCRQRLSLSDAHEEELVLRRLKWWCLVAKDCKNKTKHQGHGIDDDDIKDALLAAEPA